MDKSKSIARIIGPTLVVMALSEMKFWNPTLYDTQIVPLIYLNGMILFVAGLSIINNHNVWIYGWQTVVTIVGYAVMIIGLLRMLFPEIQKAEFKNDNSTAIVEVVLILIGVFLTFKAYLPKKVN